MELRFERVLADEELCVRGSLYTQSCTETVRNDQFYLLPHVRVGKNETLDLEQCLLLMEHRQNPGH